MSKTAFIAYPIQNDLVKETIVNAVERSSGRNIQLKPWEKFPYYGLKIDDLVRENIDECDLLIADISIPNFNVYYEIGYAVSKEKPILPIINSALDGAAKRVQKAGIFDSLGWLSYENSQDLLDRIESWKTISWTKKYEKPKDHSSPLFILDVVKKDEFRQHIFEAIANSHVNYRSFDPIEVPRLTTTRAIEEISASSGCIIPLLSKQIYDHEHSNLRAAFLAGLAHGYEIEPLLIQYGNAPSPIDYRDFITNTASRRETHGHVDDYCSSVLIRNQTASSRDSSFSLNLLNSIDLGASSAENESQSLSYYFVETAEYLRALRSEYAIVTGRKGSGKTAIFYRLRDNYRKDKRHLVVDLRTATHNLSELRHHLLSVVNQGIFDHTIAAFWHYIIYMELLLRIREISIDKSKRDYELQKRLVQIEEEFEITEKMVAGDFTSRLEMAIEDILNIVRDPERDKEFKIKDITNLIYEKSIPKLAKSIAGFDDLFEDIIVLIDDLDKGWPPQQLEDHDVLTIRHLVEILRKMERDLRKQGVEFRSLLFLRSDVYDNLVEQTSDRGKHNVIRVDWSDKSQLTHLLKERVTTNFPEKEREDAWSAVNPVLSDGEPAVDKLIEASLYRPRFLIEACEKVLSTAINRGNSFVSESDVERGLDLMSQYLVSDFGYEIRDVSGVPEDVFYEFIGQSDLLAYEEVIECLSRLDTDKDLSIIIDLLMWYGFLGIAKDNSDRVFIFDRSYDFRRLKAELPKKREDRLYAVNPAFLRGLK